VVSTPVMRESGAFRVFLACSGSPDFVGENEQMGHGYCSVEWRRYSRWISLKRRVAEIRPTAIL
jgi:hypothetical protein